MWEKLFEINDKQGSDGKYFVWKNKDENGEYYGITKEEKPPKSESGYRLLSSLLRMKGLQ